MTGQRASTLAVAAEIAALVERGLIGAEIAKRLGRSQAMVCRIARANGIDIHAGRNSERGKRDSEMMAMYRSGHTLARIGELYGITRERVRQRLAANGVFREDGGAAKRSEQRAARLLADKDKRSLARWGCTYAEYRAIPALARMRYCYHERNSRNRGIAFSLTLKEWFGIWTDSGKFSECGRGRGRYCMSRYQDSGGYEVGNVYITTNDVNAREAIRRTHKGDKKKVAVSTGVYLVYPGRSKPFVVMAGKKHVGHFADPVSAILARERYLASKSSLPPTGSGGTSAP